MKIIKLSEDGLYAYPLTCYNVDGNGKTALDYIAERVVKGTHIPIRLGHPSFDGRILSDSMFKIDNMWHVATIIGVDEQRVICQFNSPMDPNNPCLKDCKSVSILMLDHDVNRIPYCGFLYPTRS